MSLPRDAGAGGRESKRVVLRTDRLEMREMTLDDLDFVAEMMAHAEVMRFWPAPFSRQESKDWVQKQIARYRQDGHGYWLLLDEEGPVGQVGLLMTEIETVTVPALGYILHYPLWGRGYATEAAAAVRDWALERYADVAILIRPENTASLRVAERLCARRVRVITYAGFEHAVFEMSRHIR